VSIAWQAHRGTSIPALNNTECGSRIKRPLLKNDPCSTERIDYLRWQCCILLGSSGARLNLPFTCSSIARETPASVCLPSLRTTTPDDDDDIDDIDDILRRQRTISTPLATNRAPQGLVFQSLCQPTSSCRSLFIDTSWISRRPRFLHQPFSHLDFSSRVAVIFISSRQASSGFDLGCVD
jgi:hypothetical protein